MSKAWKEAGACVAIMGVAALVYRDSLTLPPGNYDPLGGGTMPRMVCVAIIVLSLVALAQSIAAASLGRIPPRAEREPGYKLRPGLAVALFGLLALYTLSIQVGIPFALSTTGFMFAATVALAGLRQQAAVPALLIAIASGVTLNYLFTSVFKVDLP